MQCHLCRGGLIVYGIELSNETLSSGDGPYILDLGAPPHDFAQVSATSQHLRTSVPLSCYCQEHDVPCA